MFQAQGVSLGAGEQQHMSCAIYIGAYGLNQTLSNGLARFADPMLREAPDSGEGLNRQRALPGAREIAIPAAR